MKFGHFLYHTNLDPERDAQSIDEALREAVVAEELGYDAVWFSEHHFTGEVAYGDPMMFAAAVAMQTTRVLLGFAVLEMGLHHPIRVAIQAALLDNLSKGRVLLGLARGSSFNAFEYRGFGTSAKEARDQIDEAEELLIRAWTSENVRYDGQIWQVAFPAIRPRPYQKPHPPLFRACVTAESVAAMAKLGRLVLFRTRSAEQAREHIELYMNTMLAAGFNEQEIERNVGQCWMWRDAYASETDTQAREEFIPGFERMDAMLHATVANWSQPDEVAPRPQRPLREIFAENTNPEHSNIFLGSPERIKDWVADLRDAGVPNLLLTHRGGVVSAEQGLNSMRLIAEKVIPHFR